MALLLCVTTWHTVARPYFSLFISPPFTQVLSLSHVLPNLSNLLFFRVKHSLSLSRYISYSILYIHYCYLSLPLSFTFYRALFSVFLIIFLSVSRTRTHTHTHSFCSLFHCLHFCLSGLSGVCLSLTGSFSVFRCLPLSLLLHLLSKLFCIERERKTIFSTRTVQHIQHCESTKRPWKKLVATWPIDKKLKTCLMPRSRS